MPKKGRWVSQDELLRINIGKKIRAARMEKAMSRNELAEAVGAAPATIANIECGHSYASARVCSGLCKALGLNEDELAADFERARCLLFDNRLWLSRRAFLAIKRSGIDTVEELCGRTADELLHIRNFGVATLEEVIRKLEEQGLALKQQP